MSNESQSRSDAQVESQEQGQQDDHQPHASNQQFSKSDTPTLPGPINSSIPSQYGSHLPVIVSSFPSGTALQQFQYQQQAAYVQAVQNQYYQHHQQQQPIHHLPPGPLPNGQIPQLHSVPQELNHLPSHQFQTPQRAMGAPSLPLSASALPKHGMTPIATPDSQRKRQKRNDFMGDDNAAELKNLAYRSLDLPLEEVAAQVRAVEISNTSSSSTPVPTDTKTQYKKDAARERQRQIFGMVWLLKSCESKNSAVVPRNRVYARYVGICADNGLKPLSPASFGKLVRVVFPNLTTRRLGMRGQSKYHYCGIKLLGDNNQPSPSVSSASTPLHNPSFDSSFLPGTPYESNSPNSFHSQASTPLPSNSTASTHVTVISSFINDHVAPDLKFVPDLLQSINNQNTDLDSPLMLPNLKPFLPPSTDLDIADTLYGLYKAHCTSVFESLRYMQLKKLFSLLSSFHGTLTAPVLKLYVSSSLHPWVIASDSVMYKAIIKMLANLALQEIPTHVLQQLKQVAQNYTEKLSTSIQHLPVKLVVSKLKLGKEFCQLISRLIRVAETAQSANKVLSHDFDRDLMEKDWIKYVDIDLIASKELPCEGDNLKKAIEILKVKVPKLLKNQDNSKELIINEWANFIAELPQQFKEVPPRLFLLCISALLTSALREISLAGGAGFGAWWVVRCWVDEWVGWCAELGGFVSHQQFDITVEERRSSISDKEKVNGKQDNNKANEESEVPVDLLDGQFGENREVLNVAEEGKESNGEPEKI